MCQARVTYYRVSQFGMSLSRWDPYVYANIRRTLPWKLQAGAFCFYQRGGINNVYQYWSQPFSGTYYGISLGRTFLKGDRLNVRAELLNPISPKYARFSINTVNGDYTGYSNSYQHRGVQARFSISYRFGSLQAQVKKTSRSIENDDLVGRKTE